jgi:preprotein translocase subunit SecG
VLYFLLLILLILNGLVLGVVVLLQSGKGGGLASMGGGMGTENLIGGRQAATLLTKATWIGGGTFMALALILSIVSSRQAAPESILRNTFTPAQQTTPAPVLPGSGNTPAPANNQPGGAQQKAPQTTAPATTNK